MSYNRMLMLVVAALIIAIVLTACTPRYDTWVAVAKCESNLEWDYGPHSNWGSRIYHGGLQFHPTTWTNYGGREFARYAYQATPLEQMQVADRVLAREGWGAWPKCSRQLGLR